ncbi:MAC/perforin domain-containing protein [Pedobacter sp. AW1-32]|uniref:MAC/perforin domain-containing protein n=1 Tax=Pedobacter sp. AW1-32 TaxID=3383026 RepID=UPI003FEF8476
MKKNLQKNILYLMLILTALGSACKKIDEIGDGKLSSNKNNLAIHGDGKWDVLGYGYDITGDYLALESISKSTIIDMTRFGQDYFNRINTPTSTAGTQHYYYGATAYDYLRDINIKRSFTASVTGGTKEPKADGDSYFTGSLTSKSENQSIYDFKSKFSYAHFEEVYRIKKIQLTEDVSLELLKNYLTPEFIANISTKTPQELIAMYGTHVLLDISLGGRLAFDFNGSIVSETTTEKKVSTSEGALGFFVKKFGINISSSKTTDEMTKAFNESRERSFGLKFFGGTNSGRSVSFDSNGYTSENVNISGWEQSVNVNNSALVDIERMAPIYDFISDPVKKEQVRVAVEQYIKDRQIKMLGEIPVYCFYSSRDNNHVYTANKNDYPYEQNGFQNFGISFYAFSTQKPGTQPVHVFYNERGRNHTYTINRYDYAYEQNGYKYLGVNFYAYPSQLNGSLPVHVFYTGAGGGDHVYTINRYDYAYEQNGFNYLGVNFYAIQ